MSHHAKSAFRVTGQTVSPVAYTTGAPSAARLAATRMSISRRVPHRRFTDMRLPCIACVALAASSCLPDAIPESARKDLVNGGERYAVGLWVNNYPAGHAAAQLVHIIVQERPFVS